MSDLPKRLQKAIRAESGIRLTPAETRRFESMLKQMEIEPKPVNVKPERREPIRGHIRWMIRRDMAEVLEIEERAFEFPWIEEDFNRCLRPRNRIHMVAEHEDRVVGFMIYEFHKAHLYLLKMAVSQEFRARTIGRQMIEKLIGKLSPKRYARLITDVPESNLGAQQFFAAMGCRAVEIRHRRDGESDYRFEYRVEVTTNVDEVTT